MGKDRLLHPAAAQGKGREVTPPAIVVAAPLSFDYPRLYDAICQVERVRKSHRRGPCGERGDCQFTAEAWAEETAMPFEMAENPVVCREMGLQRLRKLAWGMRERRIEPTAYLLSLAWHCGPSGAILRGFLPVEDRNYAERVCALLRGL